MLLFRSQIRRFKVKSNKRYDSATAVFNARTLLVFVCGYCDGRVPPSARRLRQWGGYAGSSDRSIVILIYLRMPRNASTSSTDEEQTVFGEARRYFHDQPTDLPPATCSFSLTLWVKKWRNDRSKPLGHKPALYSPLRLWSLLGAFRCCVGRRSIDSFERAHQKYYYSPTQNGPIRPGTQRSSKSSQ